MFSKSFISFLKIGIFPIVILAITSLSEFSVSQSNAINLINNKDADSLFQMAMFFIRFATVSFLLVSWAWFAGAAVFEKEPSISEAVIIGWRKFFRCFSAILIVWFLAIVYTQIIFRIIKIFSGVFFQINILSGMVSIVFVISLGLPALLFLMSKFLLLIPTTTFEKGTSMGALIKSSSYIPATTMSKTWPVLLSGSIAMVLAILLPSWTFARVFPILNPFLGSMKGVLITQLTGLAILLIAGPYAINFIVRYYFIISKKIEIS